MGGYLETIYHERRKLHLNIMTIKYCALCIMDSTIQYMDLQNNFRVFHYQLASGSYY